jgi:hypothetical protein
MPFLKKTGDKKLLTIEWVCEKFKCSPEIAKQAIQGYENYLSWEKNNNMKIISIEDQLVSKEYLFGGTPDCIFEHDGVLSIGDFKTSNAIYQDYLIQIAAYRQLWNENNPTKLITGGFHLLRFSKENADFTHHYWSELDDAWEQFKLFRKSYDLDKKLKKRI